MLRIRFNEAKATQTAALILKLHRGRMFYVKLMKLLYIIDREALLRWGRPVSTDRYVSMDNGPVLSRVLNLIVDEPDQAEGRVFWRKYISRPQNFQVSLVRQAPTDELSRAEEALISEIVEKYRKVGRWQLVDLTHKFGEYKNPDGSMIPIEYSDILKAVGKTPAQIRSILSELENISVTDSLLASQKCQPNAY
jgi:uncharacterized phage-associated protein